ncbi:MAG: hypothetical protein VX000_06625, partial [Myxococcota bacterium]|nr:hypothetical protein [Myxococcota bacterium]
MSGDGRPPADGPGDAGQDTDGAGVPYNVIVLPRLDRPPAPMAATPETESNGADEAGQRSPPAHLLEGATEA